MMRNVGFCVATVLCLLVGFAGALVVSEQVALADDPCNKYQESKEYCTITDGNASCEYWAGMGGVCVSKTGWYAQFDYWTFTGNPYRHMFLSDVSKTCAEKWSCKSDGKTCIKNVQQPSYPKQINTSVACS